MKTTIAALLLAVMPLAQADQPAVSFTSALKAYLDEQDKQTAQREVRERVEAVEAAAKAGEWAMVGEYAVTILHPETLRVYRFKGVAVADMLMSVKAGNGYRRERVAVTGCKDGHGEVAEVNIKGVPVEATTPWLAGGNTVYDWAARRICAAKAAKARSGLSDYLDLLGYPPN